MKIFERYSGKLNESNLGNSREPRNFQLFSPPNKKFLEKFYQENRNAAILKLISNLKGNLREARECFHDRQELNIKNFGSVL